MLCCCYHSNMTLLLSQQPLLYCTELQYTEGCTVLYSIVLYCTSLHHICSHRLLYSTITATVMTFEIATTAPNIVGAITAPCYSTVLYYILYAITLQHSTVLYCTLLMLSQHHLIYHWCYHSTILQCIL